jgi:hypothetical protein
MFTGSSFFLSWYCDVINNGKNITSFSFFDLA